MHGHIAMRRTLSLFGRDESGATAVEYALLIALVAFLSALVLGGIGDGLKTIFQKVTAHL